MIGVWIENGCKSNDDIILLCNARAKKTLQPTPAMHIASKQNSVMKAEPSVTGETKLKWQYEPEAGAGKKKAAR